MAEARKPTPAQRMWLLDINDGSVVRDAYSWVEGLKKLDHSGGVYRSSNFRMTMLLRDAGWIDAQQERPCFWRYRIYLTDAGRAAIGLPAATPSSQGGQP